MRLFTIGFTHKSAKQFFNLLRKNGVTTLVDARINNTSQLSCFARGGDMRFFAKEIAGMPVGRVPDALAGHQARGEALQVGSGGGAGVKESDRRRAGERVPVL